MRPSYLRRFCLGASAVSGLWLLAACGGGGDSPAATSENENLAAQEAAQAQAVWGTPETDLSAYTGRGWELQQVPTTAEWTEQAYAEPNIANPDNKRIVYVDSKSGQDAYDGLTKAKPKKNLSSITAASLAGKAAVLLKCQGSPSAPTYSPLDLMPSTPPEAAALDNLTIAAYGCGKSSPLRPVISGAVDAGPKTGWSKAGGVWQKTWGGAKPLAVYHGKTEYVMRPLIPASHPNQIAGQPAAYIQVAAGGDQSSFTMDAATASLFSNAPENIVGARIHIKTRPWIVETAKITGYDASTRKVTVAAIDPDTLQDTSTRALVFDVDAKSGYILEGKRWMLDQADEWFYDDSVSSAKKLLLMTNPAGPSGNMKLRVSVHAIGIQARWIKNLKIERVKVEHNATDGVRLIETPGADLRDVYVSQNARSGLRAMGATGNVKTERLTVRDSLFRSNAYAGIEVDNILGTQIVHNDIGWPKASAAYQGDTRHVRGALAGIAIKGASGATAAGLKSRVVNNVIRSSPRDGIRTMSTSDVEIVNNTVVSFCELFADCGGIYVGGPGPWNDLKSDQVKPYVPPVETVGRGGLIENNKVIGGFSEFAGFWHGQPTQPASATGIYLDETSNKVEVRSNFVASVELGIQLHDAFSNLIENNTIRGATHASLLAGQSRSDLILLNNRILNNSLVSYRSVTVPDFTCPGGNVRNCTEIVGLSEDGSAFAQIWRARTHDVANMFDLANSRRNVVQGNRITSIRNGAEPVWRRQLDGQMGDGGGAQWMTQSYTNRVAGERIVKRMNLSAWREATHQLTLGATEQDQSTLVAGYRQYTLTEQSTSLVTNGLPMTASGWTHYAAAATPKGQFSVLQAPACDPACGQLSAGSDSDYLASDAFNISNRAGNNLYVLRFEARSTSADVPGSLRFFSLLDGTGGAYDYTGLNTPPVILPAGGFTQFEQLFYGRMTSSDLVSDTLSSKLYIKAVGPNAGYLNRPVQLRDVTLTRVTATPTYRPPMDQLTMLVVNASTTMLYTKNLSGGVWTNEIGETISGSVTVPAGGWVQLYRKDSSWRVGN